MDAFAEETLKEASQRGIQSYLGVFGDAIEERVLKTVAEAAVLLSNGHPSASLVYSATAVEIIIRFLLVRPLVQGAFLSDEWAEIVAERIGKGRTEEDRRLLPALLRKFNIEIKSVVLPSGTSMWDTILTKVLPARNRIVHVGESASKEIAETAIQCAKTLLDDVVHKVATSLGFTLDRTGKWCEIHDLRVSDHGKSESWASFTPRSPFETN